LTVGGEKDNGVFFHIDRIAEYTRWTSDVADFPKTDRKYSIYDAQCDQIARLGGLPNERVIDV